MEDLFRDILDWVALHPGWAYITVFAVAMTESTAVIGVFVPGVVLLVGTGALITTDAISFWPAFAFAVAGAIVGDGLSYSVGRHYNDRLRRLWPFCRYPEQLEQGVRFFDRFGGWSVAIGRFAGPSRAIVPLVAGMLNMPPRRFYVANITSAIAQTLAFFIPGMIFGASMKLAAEAALRLVILTLLLGFVLWFALWLAHRIYRLLSPHASAWLQGLLRWADLHPAMGRVAHALADPGHPDSGTLTALAFLLILASFLVGAVTGVTLLGAPELAINRSVLDLGQSLHTPLGDRVMVGLAQLGNAWTILPTVALVYAYLRWRGRHRHAYYWLAASAFPLMAIPLLGALLQVPRPDLGLGLLLPWSFPSGAVLLATSVYGFLAVSLARGLPERFRWVPYGLATLAVTAVGAAGLYLGTEWLTDIVGSIALGLAWVAALGLAFRRHSRRESRSRALGAVALVSLIASLTVHEWIDGNRDLARLTPAERPETLTLAEWHASGWQRLPSRRADISQRDRHPLTLQYAGDLQALTQALMAAGWEPADLLDWGNAVRLLSPSLPLAELPVIPQVHDGHHEGLVLTRPRGEAEREVLRLWSTPFRLEDQTPLWVGNLSRQHKAVHMNLIAFPATDPAGFPAPPELGAGIEAFAAHRPAGSDVLLVEPRATSSTAAQERHGSTQR